MDWNSLETATDWNDLDKIIEGGSAGGRAAQREPKEHVDNYKRGPANSTSYSNGNKNDRSAAKDPQDQDQLENANVGNWTDMKMFDDDHDTDWFDEEEKRLAKMYGGHFIKVQYTEQGRPGYFCELCLAEMNAKKSLEAHCEGMKHLKKKALWEKNNSGDAEERKERDTGRMGGWMENMPVNTRDRGGFTPRDRDRGRSRSPVKRSMDNRVSGRGRDDRDFNHRGGRQRDDRARSRSSDRFGGPPRGGDRNDRVGRGGDRDNDRFGGSSRGGDRDRGSRDNRRGDGVSPPYEQQKKDRMAGPPSVSFGAPAVKYDGSGVGGGYPQWGAGANHPSGPPPAAPVDAAKEKLGGGITGILLSKLASCCINDEEDADLALNVVSSLTSSLREYNTKQGQKKMAELLMETELKLNTLKALKVGLKLLDNKKGELNKVTPALVAYPPIISAAPVLYGAHGRLGSQEGFAPITGLGPQGRLGAQENFGAQGLFGRQDNFGPPRNLGPPPPGPPDLSVNKPVKWYR